MRLVLTRAHQWLRLETDSRGQWKVGACNAVGRRSGTRVLVLEEVVKLTTQLKLRHAARVDVCQALFAVTHAGGSAAATGVDDGFVAQVAGIGATIIDRNMVGPVRAGASPED